MKWVPRILLLAVALAAGAVCVRLGFWQLSRRAEKRHANAAMEAALAGPALDVGDSLPRWERVGRRVVVVRGRFDDHRQILIAGREHIGQPGVGVVTPLLTASGGAVLVDRGWLPAEDPTLAHPERYPESVARPVRALA